MKQVYFRSFVVLVVTLLFCGGLFFFYGKLAVIGDDWAAYPTNRHIYADGHLVKAGTITDRNGNTTAATIPSCLYDYENALRKGDNLILASFGGGFTWGAVYVKWAYDGDKVSE